MTFKEFGQELKEARLKNGIVLEQIASKTRINIKFLEYIEEGNFAEIKFEEPFVRAFLRQYAQAINLDPKEVLSKYEKIKYGPAFEKHKKEKAADQITDEDALEGVENYNEINPDIVGNVDEFTLNQAKKRAVLFIGGLIILGLIIGLVYRAIIKEKTETVIKEIRSEEVAPPVDIEQVKGMIKKKEEKKEEPKRDSLLLTIFAKDSCWIKVEIDSVKEKPLEFLLFPNTKKTLKAAKRFDFNVGNSRALEFTLNGKKLEFEGYQKKIRYFSIEEQGIKTK